MVQPNSKPLTIQAGDESVDVFNLTLEQIAQIDRSLAEIDNYGEVRLIVERGRYRITEVIRSRRV